MASDFALRDAQTILVVTKFRFLGDTIVATPLLRTLRSSAPNARIVLLSNPASGLLLQCCDFVDEHWAYSPYGSGRLGKVAAMTARIRGEKFDAAFLPNRSLHSAAIVAAARVPARIGFDTEHRGPLLTHRVPYRKNATEIDCTLDLARAVHAEPIISTSQLVVSQAEREAARCLTLLALKADRSERLALMQPGSKDPERKRWNTDRFVRVAQELVQNVPAVRLAIIGVEDEREQCDAVCAAMQGSAMNLCGKTDLRTAMGLIAEADQLIACDTALVHVAAALGTPTVAIHGPMTAQRWGYTGDGHCVVTAPSPAGESDRLANRLGLDALEWQTVAEAAIEQLRTSNRWEKVDGE